MILVAMIPRSGRLFVRLVCAASLALRALDVRVRELRLQLPTLEEFFVQVTEGVDAAAAAGVPA